MPLFCNLHLETLVVPADASNAVCLECSLLLTVIVSAPRGSFMSSMATCLESGLFHDMLEGSASVDR